MELCVDKDVKKRTVYGNACRGKGLRGIRRLVS